MPNFPTSLDTLSNPSGSTQLSDPTLLHSGQHGTVNDIIEALQAKLGIGSSTPVADRILGGTGSGQSGYRQVANADIATGTIDTTKLSFPAISNPMTTADDIIVGGSSGTPTRKAKGSNSRVLGVDSAGVLGYRQVTTDDIVDGTIVMADLADGAVSELFSTPISATSTTSTGLVLMAGSGLAMTWRGGRQLIYAQLVGFNAASATFAQATLYINGAPLTTLSYNDITTSRTNVSSDIWTAYPAGSYTLQMYWFSATGAQIQHLGGVIYVVELVR